MANYLYNGVELPDINTVWTDKTTYPYAMIARANSGKYQLRVSNAPFYYEETSYGTAEAGSSGTQLISSVSVDPVADGVWGALTQSYGADTVLLYSTPFLWANHDVVYKDTDNVYQAATDPVLVDTGSGDSGNSGESGGGEGGSGSGDGESTTPETSTSTAKYLYNDTIMPELPTLNYPHAYIIRQGDTCLLYITEKLGYVDTNEHGYFYGKDEDGEWMWCNHSMWAVALDKDASLYPGISTSVWTLMTDDEPTAMLPYALMLWTNTTIYDQDGNVYMEASEPIAVESDEPQDFDIRAMVIGMTISARHKILRGGGGSGGGKLSSIKVWSQTSDYVEIPAPGFTGIGSVTVLGDSNLVPGNIKDGVTILGIKGDYKPPDPVPTPTVNVKLTTKKATINENGTHSIYPNSGSDGMTRVDVTVDVPTTEEVVDAVLEPLTVTPKSASQSITPGEGVDGFSSVSVEGDSDLKPENIKAGVTIFGVGGTYEKTELIDAVLQSKRVTPTPSGFTVRPDEGNDGLTYVEIVGDSDLIPSNIREGVEIFGVAGSYSNGQKYQTKESIIPTRSGVTVTADSGYNALAQVKILGDPNLVPERIANGVTIFGVRGTYVSPTDTVEVQSGLDEQIIVPAPGYVGFSAIKVLPAKLDNDEVYQSGYEAGYAAGKAAAESQYTNLDGVRF